MPVLALVPIAPLAVQDARFAFTVAVRHYERHRQIQMSEDSVTKNEVGADAYSRPWFLVPEPVSIKGVIARPNTKDGEALGEASNEATIDIEVRLAAMKL